MAKRKKVIPKKPKTTDKSSKAMTEAFLEYYGTKKEYGNLRIAANNTADWTFVDFIDPYNKCPCLPLEYLYGSRGLLSGRISLLQAAEGVGKSSYIALCFGMGAITSNAMCLLLESESAEFPEDRLVELGCDPNAVFHAPIIDLPKCLMYINNFVRDVRAFDPEKESPVLIGVDSLSSLSEIEMETSDEAVDVDLSKAVQPGKHAKMLSEWLRKGTTKYLHDNKVSLMFTGQLKQKINTGFGYQAEKETTLGGRAVRFHSTYILTLKATPYKMNGVEVGTQLNMYMAKNKVAPAHRAITMELYREGGFKPNSGLLDMLVNARSGKDGTPLFDIKQSGGWYSWGALTDKKFQRNDIMNLLYSNEDFLMHVREQLRIRGYGFAFEKQCTLEDYEQEKEKELQNEE